MGELPFEAVIDKISSLMMSEDHKHCTFGRKKNLTKVRYSAIDQKRAEKYWIFA